MGLGDFFEDIAGGVLSAFGKGAAEDFFGDSNARTQYNRSIDMMNMQADINKEFYKNRYRWTTEDMRAAGLNPILAASGGFSVGQGPSVGLPAVSMAPTPNMPTAVASARDVVQMKKTDAEIGEVFARTSKANNEAIESIERARQSRAQQNLITTQEAKTAEEVLVAIRQVDSITKNIEKMTHEILALDQKVEVGKAEVQTMALQRKVLKEEAERLATAVKVLKLGVPELEKTAEVYRGRGGTVIKYAEEILHAIGPGITGGLVGGMFGSFMRSGRRKGIDWSKENFGR